MSIPHTWVDFPEHVDGVWCANCGVFRTNTQRTHVRYGAIDECPGLPNGRETATEPRYLEPDREPSLTVIAARILRDHSETLRKLDRE